MFYFGSVKAFKINKSKYSNTFHTACGRSGSIQHNMDDANPAVNFFETYSIIYRHFQIWSCVIA